MQDKSIAESSKYSAIHLTCIKQLLLLKTYLLSSFELLFKTGFTVLSSTIYSQLPYINQQVREHDNRNVMSVKIE